MSNLGRHHVVKINDSVGLSDSIEMISESRYLINANKQRCKEIFSKQEWRHGELIDGFIALHIVLEAGLNCFFRHIALLSLRKEVDQIQVMKNIDEISFIHKTTLFIYNSKFNFDKLSKAGEYHKIIDILKQFCAIRNSLLHGHAIATLSNDQTDEPKHTEIRKQLISGEKVKQQLQRFRFILEGMRYYVDCMEDLPLAEKERFKEDFLDHTFLPDELTTAK